MPTLTREEREHQLVATLLENRRNLYAAYAVAFGEHPPSWLTDREMIIAILRKEFPARSAPMQPR